MNVSAITLRARDFRRIYVIVSFDRPNRPSMLLDDYYISKIMVT